MRIVRAICGSILLILLLPPAQALDLQATADHAPWTDGRYAVRPGNCMTWDVLVTDGGEPIQGAGVSVTDTDGRRSMSYTGSDGAITIGTRDCWTSDHILDIAFEVTAMIDGSDAMSNRVVHEVMWSRGQVYVDLPADTNTSFEAPVTVVWTATNEPMPVAAVRAEHGGATIQLDLQQGQGNLQITDAAGQLTVSVPSSLWLSGGPSALIPVLPAGPFAIGQDAPADNGGSNGGGASNGGGGSNGAGSTDVKGEGIPPPVVVQERQMPPTASYNDTGEWDETDDQPADTENTPLPLAIALIALMAAYRRRQ